MRRRLPLIGGIVLAILIAIGFWQHVRAREVTLVGLVDANEYVVTPRVQAHLDSLWVDEGSVVRAGQRIGVLERDELTAQAAASTASAVAARAQLQQSEASERQTIGETQSGVAGASARLAAAQADLARQTAQLAQVKLDADRAAAMLKAGAIAQADLDRATTTLHVQEAAVAASREQVHVAEEDVSRARAELQASAAARGAVATTRARVASAEADSAAARARLDYADLRALADGVVQVLTARRGELVGPGAPVAVIVDVDHPWVRVGVPEDNAGAIAVGDSLPVTLLSGRRVTGRVISKGVEGDFATQHNVSVSKRDIRAVTLRIAIANPGRTIVPGMTASVTLPTSHSSSPSRTAQR
jgi:HlyD family secretion protein